MPHRRGTSPSRGRRSIKLDASWETNRFIGDFNLVTFLALGMYMTMELCIANRGMTSKYTPLDILFEYSSMVSITTRTRVMTQAVPANVRKIEQDIGLGLYPDP